MEQMQQDFLYYQWSTEKDVQWSEEGISSAFKFVQKLWNLNKKIIEEMEKDLAEDSDQELEKNTNIYLKKVSNNLESFSYNKIVANFHEIYTYLSKQINNNYRKETIYKNYQKILVTMICYSSFCK